MCKVSVILPVYNVEAYLQKCVASVQAQTAAELEILLVDDGSTDASGQLCDSLAASDSRIRVLHQENAGQGSARNAGLQAATGKYVLFVDSDDMIEPQLLEKTLSVAEKHQAQVVMFDLQGVNEAGERQYATKQHVPENVPLSSEDCKELLLTDPSPCNKLFSRAFLQEKQFAFPLGIWYEDLIAITNLDADMRAVVYIGGEPLYDYLLRGNSSLRNGDAEKTVANRIRAIEMIFSHYREIGAQETFAEQLEWIAAYHGFFLPAREILHFTNKPGPYLKKLKENLLQYTAAPMQNPYFARLSSKERLMFRLLYLGNPVVLRLLLKLNSFLK